MALDDKKLPEDLAAEPDLASDIRHRLGDGMLSCRAAFESAASLKVAPARIGRTADALRLRLTECQIGLFGFPGHAKGWAAAGVESLFREQQRYDTPHLAIRYQPAKESTYWRS